MQSNYTYSKETFDITNSNSYVFSLDGSIFASINKNNNFSLYFLEDIGRGRIKCFYNNTDVAVSALSFTNLSNFSLLNKRNSPNLEFKFHSSPRSFNDCSNQIVIAKNNEKNLQIMDLSNFTFSSNIKITDQVISMKTDKFNSSQIFYIEKETRNLIKFNLYTLENELIAKSVNFFEELLDGSLIISTESGIKYFDKQANFISIHQTQIKPLAFFPLSHNKVLMITSTKAYPAFTVLDPLSSNIEASYKIPYFKVSNPDKKEEYFCYPNKGSRSFYIGSSTSTFVVHCVSEGDFYSIEKVENVNFPILGICKIPNSSNAIAIFGESNVVVMTENKEIAKFPKSSKEIDIDEIDIDHLISQLPEPSDPIRTVEFLKKEADPVIKSFKFLNQNIKAALNVQLDSFALQHQIESKKKWEASDSEFYRNKLQNERECGKRLLQMSDNQKKSKQVYFTNTYVITNENTSIDLVSQDKGNKSRHNK